MKATEKDLKNIEITTYESGFTVWIKEKIKVGNKYRTVKHWVIDGSCLTDDGEIRLGGSTGWKLNAEYDADKKAIYITRKK